MDGLQFNLIVASSKNEIKENNIKENNNNISVSEFKCTKSDEVIDYVWGPPRKEKIEKIPEDIGDHSLLKEVSIGYTASVIQRAFITWMQLSRSNDFKNVCDYYHRLDKLESTYPVERSLDSRRHEYQMIDAAPPMTDYFIQNWGHIYGYKEKSSIDDRLQDLWSTEVIIPPIMPFPDVTMVPVPLLPVVPLIPVHQIEQEALMAGRHWST